MKAMFAMALLASAYAVTAGGTGIDSGAGRNAIDMNLTQSELDSSKAWKDYKALVKKANTSETVADLKKLRAGSDIKYDRVREFFIGNKQLSSDLIVRCEHTISSRINMYTPRLARLPRPDYESIVKNGFAGLNRSIRIVEEFQKAKLEDEFIESIRKELVSSVSALRNTLPELDRARKSRPPNRPISDDETIEALNLKLQPLSGKVDEWEIESRQRSGQSSVDFLLQSELDTSSLWGNYCGLHHQILIAKSADSLADIPKRAKMMEKDLSVLFRDSNIANSLVAWVKMSSESKAIEITTPKRVSGTREDWARLLSEFSLIQTESSIAGYFRDHELGHTLIWTMTGRLSPRTQNLVNNARSFRSNAGYKDAAPGTLNKLTADQERLIQEIEAFDESTQRTLAKWNKNPK